MITYHTADYLYPITSAPIKNGVIGLDESGKITAVLDPASPTYAAPATAPIRHEGVLIPGFINTHCHLELSHLVGKSQTGKTLLPFLVDVITMRASDQATIDAAIMKQDKLMWEAGIQAVGDICNKADTAATKRASPIRYYSFVEMFDFLQPAAAESNFETYLKAYEEQAGSNEERVKGKDRKAAVPHAPYTVSDPLYALINSVNTGQETVSIHNQETPAEDELFQTGGGAFVDFFKGFGASLDNFEAPGITSIRHAMKHMDPTKRTIFVHNTLTSDDDIHAAHAWGQSGVYWATCPNANLYIENRLPNYARFLNTDAKVTIGTDSLTSNWQLSVLEELRTISKYQSYVSFATLLRWATINGAEALQFADLGSLEVGKTPGLLELKNLRGTDPDTYGIGEFTEVERIS
ncbi:amidohydrolase family protein [Neolewinella antarctica]|uniref:Cytosine/adenosine deaminase-related metal-dependent hydrolase n=1 Tax=Neolewinella antarctica TaxID=442734 RepID=A0ABX0XCM0_9BACT|nr:amidohydrolase family protein [Neolewinella antarctica]NJC26810.1 cytosine/adenosine deaminase-related metal-dependent hydrolase [Neolewinella antarctica]